MFGATKNIVNTDPQKIEDFLNRGIENIFPNKNELRKRLLSGKQITIYLGIDPTGPTLHMGHAIPLKKLGQLQKMGHKVILLIGDFTAMIGDPDKLSVRKPLTQKEVLSNCRLYKKQASIFLNFSGSNKAELKFNSKWLAKMNFSEILNLSSKITVDQILKRDMFQQRIKENRPLYLHEFMYPVMQGYDSVVMNVDAEIGGNDQMFNMLTGRDLMKEFLGKEKFVITMKLLVDSGGKKMGKTEGNGILLTDNGSEKFGKVMSWTDDMIISGFELCTNISSEKIEEYKKDLSAGINPKDLKVKLAKEIVSIYHGTDVANKAEANFVNTFKKGGVPEGVKEVEVSKGNLLVDVLISAEIIKSKTEWRRLVEEGAINEIDSKENISDYNFTLEKDSVWKIGKKRFVKIKIK